MSATMQLPITQRIRRRLRALVRDRRANTAVEFALAAPAIFMFMFGIIEVGYALWMQNALDYSVAAASRCASLSGSACTGSPQPGDDLCRERVRCLSRQYGVHLYAHRQLRLSGERHLHHRPRHPVGQRAVGKSVVAGVLQAPAFGELRILNPQ